MFTFRSLTCRYLNHKSPYLMLGPFKMEEIHHDPFLVQFYDFLTDEETEELKTLASDKLSLSAIAGVNAPNVLRRTRSDQ